ncbi:MAG: patatin-like phospholipase family protein [bacterium]
MKIGLALGGGAVYGYAHIGVIKVLEANGIKPEFIAGTSIGALMGGLYASGVPIAEVEKISKEFKWQEIINVTIPTEGLMSIDKLKSFMEKHAKCKEIEDTKIKFVAVATNLLNGKERIFDEGSLGLAIRASCSLPAIFTPAIYDDGVYVDGGIINNVPISVVKNMGADFIIGVDVTAKAKPNVIKNHDIFNIVWQSFLIMIQENSSFKSYKDADFLIVPDIKNFAPFDLSQRERIIKKGEEAAEKEIGNILAKIKEKGSLLGKVKDILSKEIS